MKKKLLALSVAVLLIVTLSLALVGCVDNDKKEVEVDNAIASLDIDYLKELPSGALDRVLTTLQDIHPSEIRYDVMDMRHHVLFWLKWNFDVAKSYKFTRVTFDVTANNFDNPSVKIELRHFIINNSDNGDTLEQDYDFMPNVSFPVEFNFGDSGIECGTQSNYRVFRLSIGSWGDKSLDEAAKYMNWKISNFKIYGIEK